MNTNNINSNCFFSNEAFYYTNSSQTSTVTFEEVMEGETTAKPEPIEKKKKKKKKKAEKFEQGEPASFAKQALVTGAVAIPTFVLTTFNSQSLLTVTATKFELSFLKNGMRTVKNSPEKVAVIFSSVLMSFIADFLIQRRTGYYPQFGPVSLNATKSYANWVMKQIQTGNKDKIDPRERGATVENPEDDEDINQTSRAPKLLKQAAVVTVASTASIPFILFDQKIFGKQTLLPLYMVDFLSGAIKNTLRLVDNGPLTWSILGTSVAAGFVFDNTVSSLTGGLNPQTGPIALNIGMGHLNRAMKLYQLGKNPDQEAPPSLKKQAIIVTAVTISTIAASLCNAPLLVTATLATTNAHSIKHVYRQFDHEKIKFATSGLMALAGLGVDWITSHYTGRNPQVGSILLAVWLGTVCRKLKQWQLGITRKEKKKKDEEVQAPQVKIDFIQEQAKVHADPFIPQQTSIFRDFTSAVSCYLTKPQTPNLEEGNPHDPVILAAWQEEEDPIGTYK